MPRARDHKEASDRNVHSHFVGDYNDDSYFVEDNYREPKSVHINGEWADTMMEEYFDDFDDFQDVDVPDVDDGN
jgi:hypothetical protein